MPRAFVEVKTSQGLLFETECAQQAEEENGAQAPYVCDNAWVPVEGPTVVPAGQAGADNTLAKPNEPAQPNTP
ncbi:hypothetical protein ACF08N_15385 [Streptomyces sp. NPDC015127]|uniref:hypothetical protein n=1 Tax=Streptomyces sp. NPDC015127 TaxID=3364939 RepID=UPI0036FE05A4